MAEQIVPSDIDVESLPDLNPAQFKFVELIVSGMGPTAAYMQAYPNCSVKRTAWQKACHLKHHPGVKAWYGALREAMFARYIDSAEGYVAEMRALYEQCKRTGNMNAAVRAMENIGKAEGHFDRNVVSIEQGEDGDLIQSIKVSLGPLAARAVAQKLGLPMDSVGADVEDDSVLLEAS